MSLPIAFIKKIQRALTEENYKLELSIMLDCVPIKFEINSNGIEGFNLTSYTSNEIKDLSQNEQATLKVLIKKIVHATLKDSCFNFRATPEDYASFCEVINSIIPPRSRFSISL